MSDKDMQAVFQLQDEISRMVDEAICDHSGLRGIYCAGDEYEMEESEDPNDSFVFVRKSDGKRFEVEFDVFVRELPPKPEAPDPDAPVHIEGQEEIPLGIGGPG